ncbi:esterase-like activity of phytase family protein [Aurantiacibacter xanthus]|uniref:Esterase-like activity of phytase family protein n=1 Tax=Aurantiacibacter xanthus TaxID=1784712 RepID=A0A3A1P3C3_9SPHN|nr:esterase-like activity of phytase family protein [Aurantiacibacter xanthus]RIV85398.1 esterase-like activity of phytase family protein [Aurantiacibacter xanthus]
MRRPRIKRLALVVALSLLIAPGTWLRDDPNAAAQDLVRLEQLDVAQPEGWPDGLTLAGAWNVANPNPDFGGYSALRIDPEGAGFIAYSDRGTYARLPRPPFAGSAPALTAVFPRDPLLHDPQDVESVTSDPASGTIWMGYENHNAIRRYSPNGTSQFVQPRAMDKWKSNSGPESMVRLSDGRFIVLAEAGGDGLLFAGDPLTSDEPLKFIIMPPGEFLPTDMAQLPDGRVLILFRDLQLAWPPFASLLMVADPAAIRKGKPWPLTELARIDGAGLRENYEGMAIEPDGDGVATVWLIADDNLSLLQRTLLLKLRYAYGG